MGSEQRALPGDRVHLSDPTARPTTAELPRALSEALGDPIVQALMAADGVARESVEELMRRVIARCR